MGFKSKTKEELIHYIENLECESRRMVMAIEDISNYLNSHMSRIKKTEWAYRKLQGLVDKAKRGY